MKCNINTCNSDATCALAINVPALNCPIAEHDPIRVVFGLQLCEKCLVDQKAFEFFTPDGKLEKIIRIAARGKAEPDFNRAFVTRVDFDSQEWKTLQKNRR